MISLIIRESPFVGGKRKGDSIVLSCANGIAIAPKDQVSRAAKMLAEEYV